MDQVGSIWGNLGQPLTRFSPPGTATTTIPAVQTAVPNNDLVHGCVYTVGIEYRDRAPNDPVLVER